MPRLPALCDGDTSVEQCGEGICPSPAKECVCAQADQEREHGLWGAFAAVSAIKRIQVLRNVLQKGLAAPDPLIRIVKDAGMDASVYIVIGECQACDDSGQVEASRGKTAAQGLVLVGLARCRCCERVCYPYVSYPVAL